MIAAQETAGDKVSKGKGAKGKKTKKGKTGKKKGKDRSNGSTTAVTLDAAGFDSDIDPEVLFIVRKNQHQCEGAGGR